jgi:hypothetical protein
MQPITPTAESQARALFAVIPGNPDEALELTVKAEDGESYDCLCWLTACDSLEFDCFDNGKRGRLARWGASIASAIVDVKLCDR